MLEALLDAVFPPQSLSGSGSNRIPEEELLAAQSLPLCFNLSALRERGITDIDSLVAACSYAESPVVQRALHRLKYRSVASLAVPLARLLAGTTPMFHAEKGTVLCPVPLHWSRKFARGFNQSQLLAEALSASCGYSVVQCLRRIRSTGRQAVRTRAERLASMRGAFCVEHCGELPPHIILLDDVATTGATLDACAATLKEAGVLRVDALVVAFNV